MAKFLKNNSVNQSNTYNSEFAKYVIIIAKKCKKTTDHVAPLRQIMSQCVFLDKRVAM